MGDAPYGGWWFTRRRSTRLIGFRATSLAHAFLGSDFSDRDAYKALGRANLPQVNRQQETTDSHPGDVERVAQILSAGKTVAICEVEWNGDLEHYVIAQS